MKPEQKTMEQNLEFDITKITDVNQFCLGQIFMYLNLEDLLSVADANKYLKRATYTIFMQKYAGKSVKIDVGNLVSRPLFRPSPGMRHICIRPEETKYGPVYDELSDVGEEINILKLKTIFQMLRCFGPIIKKLHFMYGFDWFGDGYKTHHRIMEYVSEFCAESLTKMITEARAINQYKKTFSNVEELIISEKCNETICLNSIYPKLRILRIGPMPYFGLLIADTFPYLQELDLTLANVVAMTYDSYKSAVATALRLNPHLKSLSIKLNDFVFLREISDNLQSLESLDVSLNLAEGSFYNNEYSDNEEKIYFRNVTFFRMNCMTSVRHTTIPSIPILFEQLKVFTLEGHGEYELHHDQCDYDDPSIMMFFNTNRTIEKLTLKRKILGTLTDPTMLHEALPALSELTCANSWFDIDYVYDQFENTFTFLERLNFYGFSGRPTDRRSLIDQVRGICSEKCQVSNPYGRFIKLERIED
ncbi:uncharacterized protein LOC129578821 [Sitodiplosis mosellana]|uniref:uncharacterized protein LOC129578821 n=1 Tax=Sitodiplosis mosellana TaxID=263140 RepID=UPI00244469D9|nr:uncharacterized protein LOC129578821 [Sitodiplosis mosellana]